MKQTAGTLLYRRMNGVLEVLLVHPSGNYNKKSPWSIPKGLPDEAESMEQAARRETLEETGVVAGPLEILATSITRKARKECIVFSDPLRLMPNRNARLGGRSGGVCACGKGAENSSSRSDRAIDPFAALD